MLLTSKTDLRSVNYTVICVFILLTGTCLRLWLYFQNHSLWLDEVMLSISIVEKDIPELAGSLEYDQKAPFGFLFFQKLSVLLLGPNEMALRLFSLLCGIAAPVIFFQVSKRYAGKTGTLVATACVSFAYPLIHHSVEGKQYMSEFTSSIIILYFLQKFQDHTDYKHALHLGIAGAILQWFSFPVLNILFSIGVVFAIVSLYRIYTQKNWSLFFYLTLFSGCWLLSFIINYVLFIEKGITTAWLVNFWDVRDTFAVFPPKNIDDIKWFFKTIFQMFRYPLGLNISWINNKLLQFSSLGFVLFLAGVPFLFKKNKLNFFIISAPILVAYFISSLKLYPFTERFLMFLAPFLFILIGCGSEYIVSAVSSKKYSFSILIISISIGGALSNSLFLLSQPKEFNKYTEFRDGIVFLHNNTVKGDVVYVHWGASAFYRFYNSLYPIQATPYFGKKLRNISNSADEFRTMLEKDLEHPKKDNRVWYLLNTENIISSKYHKTDIKLAGITEKTEAELIEKVLRQTNFQKKTGGQGFSIFGPDTMDTQAKNILLNRSKSHSSHSLSARPANTSVTL